MLYTTSGFTRKVSPAFLLQYHNISTVSISGPVPAYATISLSVSNRGPVAAYACYNTCASVYQRTSVSKYHNSNNTSDSATKRTSAYKGTSLCLHSVDDTDPKNPHHFAGSGSCSIMFSMDPDPDPDPDLNLAHFHLLLHT